MNQFYISIIFIGIILIIIALVGIFYDRKRAYDSANQLEEKKNELIGIINDAEKMIEELNRFSDYVVTQMELKNQELNKNLKQIEQRIQNLNIKQDENSGAAEAGKEYEDKGGLLEMQAVEDVSGATNISEPSFRNNEKIIPLNSKHKEVIKLSKNGMDDTQIAKRLNMGKGEIRLILEMNK